MRSASEARSRQQAWAEAEGISVDESGYVSTLEDNLFVPLSAATRIELSGGNGNELGGPGRRGKMQALHSSSALAYNVFEYWRQREDRDELRAAMELPLPIKAIAFEGKFATGLGAPAHVDVVLEVGDGLVAVESKFLEPFGSSKPYKTFSTKYFPSCVARWADVGLPHCQTLAEQVNRDEVEFLRLDVPQLMKHALGLWRMGRPDVSLWYLYVEMKGVVGERHQHELELFQERVGEEIRFRALSYNRLIERLHEQGNPAHTKYLAFLTGRYRGED